MRCPRRRPGSIALTVGDLRRLGTRPAAMVAETCRVLARAGRPIGCMAVLRVRLPVTLASLLPATTGCIAVSFR